MNTELQNARGGDLQAFELVVRQHQADVFALALQLTGQHSTASALAQEAFVQLHAAIARITSAAHLRHWLLRSVSQLALDQPWQPADETRSSDTAGPGPEFTARVMAHVELRWSHRRADFAPAAAGKTHRHRRNFLVGATIAAGLAAVVAVWWWTNQPATTDSTRNNPTASAGTTQPTPPVAVSRTPGPSPTNASRISTQTDGFPHYTVVALPPRQESLDPEAIAPVEAFHAALLAELRRIPGMVLLVPGVTAPPDPQQPADYLLMVTSLESMTLAGGGAAFRVTDNRNGTLSAGSTAAGRQWPVELRILPAGNTSSSAFVSTVQIGKDQDALQQIATQQVGILRDRMLPDALIRQQLITRFRDPALAPMERQRALADLLGDQRDRASGLTSIEIGAIVAGAANLPADERVQLWRELRGAPNADLVEPLIESARHDLSLGVRYEALATLAADYAADPRARAALDVISRDDPEQVMRVAARRSAAGEAEWRAYVTKTLKDTRLPLPDRLSPMLLAARSASTPAELQAMKTLTTDKEISNLLAALIRDSWFDYTQATTIADALVLLTGSDNPAPASLLVQIPQDMTRPSMATAPVIAAVPQVSPAAMSWLSRNRNNNPMARRILDDLARGNVDPRAVAMIEQMMQQRPPGAPDRRR